MKTTRRQVLKAGLAGFIGALPLWGCATRGREAGPLLGFEAIPASAEDKLIVPAGYRAQTLYAWGDPVGAMAGSPAFRWDGGNSADEQELQAGMHHDAIELFPLDANRALLAVNHEYTDDGLLHADGMATWTADKVRKSQAAHGVAVIEVAREGDGWKVARPSKYARRITAYTPMRFSGPAAGSALLVGPVAGTINNCAGGRTPWGTYLTCEENFNLYFANAGAISAEHKRYGIGAKSGYRWHEHDRRFDAQANPLEANKFGWVVEIDPYNPDSVPVKRTALGRFKHEGAMVTRAEDGRIVVYMGDDEAFEYIYKFVSAKPFDGKNRDVLDEGTLYAAKFEEGGHGRWLPLPRTAEAMVNTRQAADQAGATKMDRPEWIAVHPVTQEVYATLTNNSARKNVYGHIIKWREQGGDPASTQFRWKVFALGGEDKGFGSPDGLWFDPRGLLWIQTDVSTSALNRGPYAKIGNNQMLAADITTGEIRRFLTGPSGCEVTGAAMSADGRAMFVNIQHPGEAAGDRSDPARPRAVSNWPDYRADGRPRSATVVITRSDGGLIGT